MLTDEEAPGLTVVVPAYNERENIVETLNSIVNSDYPKGKLNVAVVDDGSTDDTYQTVKRYMHVAKRKGVHIDVLKKRNGGAADAKNYGLSKTRTTLIATLDGDSVLERSALRILASYIMCDENVGGVSGAIRVYRPENVLEKIQNIEYDINIFLKRLIMGIESVSTTPGGLSMFRTKIIKKLGGFKKNSLAEDEEIAINLQKHGYYVWTVINGISYTKVPSDLWTLIKQRTRWIRGSVANRILIHNDLISPKAGDFWFFGMMLSFLFILPILSIMVYLIYTSAMDMLNTGLMIQPPTLDTHIILMAMIVGVSGIWVGYALNAMDRRICKKKFRIKRIPFIILYVIIYGYFWVLVWINVLITEIKERGRYTWGTR